MTISNAEPLMPACHSEVEDPQYLVYSWLTVQFLCLCGIILINLIQKWLRNQRQKERERKHTVSLDIEQQTRRPLRRPPVPLPSNENLDHYDSRSQLPNIDETIPLLPVARQHRPRKFRSLLQTWCFVKFKTLLYSRCYLRRTAKTLRFLGYKIHAWTMLQPNSIPIFGCGSPSNAISLGIATMLVVNIVFLLVSLPMDRCFFPALTRRAAILYTINTPMLCFLSIKAQPLQTLTSWSHVETNIFHRRLGEFMMFLILIHSTGHILPMALKLVVEEGIVSANQDSKQHLEVWNTSARRSTHTSLAIVSGLVAFFSLIAIVATSTPKLRRKSYRIFLRVHTLSHLVAHCSTFVHSPFARPYVGLAIVSWALDRFISRRLARRSSSNITTTYLPDGVLLMSIEPNLPNSPNRQSKRLKSRFLRLLTASWAPGCHILLKRKYAETSYDEEWHLCYLMGAKNRTDPFFEDNSIRLLITSDEPWSRQSSEVARRPPIWGVDLEGPYGSMHSLEMISDRDICILVASIPGMAPMLSIAQSLVDWSNGYHPVTNASTPSRQCIFLIVVCDEQRNIDWFLRQLYRLEAGGIQTRVLTTTTDQPDPLNLLVQTIDWRIEDDDTAKDKRIGIVCCGSRGLEKAVRKCAGDTRSKGHQCLVDTLPLSPRRARL